MLNTTLFNSISYNLIIDKFKLKWSQMRQTFSELCQTSEMRRFMKIVNSFYSLTISAKHSILDVWEGSTYTYEYYSWNSAQHWCRQVSSISYTTSVNDQYVLKQKLIKTKVLRVIRLLEVYTRLNLSKFNQA